jgi:hypothetical protein
MRRNADVSCCEAWHEPKTVAKYRDAIPWIKEAFDDHRCRFNELAKKTMHKFIGTDWKAAAWWLERMCKDEGFGKEIKVDADVTQRGRVIIMLPDNGRNPGIHERRQRGCTFFPFVRVSVLS